MTNDDPIDERARVRVAVDMAVELIGEYGCGPWATEERAKDLGAKSECALQGVRVRFDRGTGL